jgi:hypothetical protein
VKVRHEATGAVGVVLRETPRYYAVRVVERQTPAPEGLGPEEVWEKKSVTVLR